MTYGEVRAMYTAYIERVAGYARREYLRSARYRPHEVPLDSLPEEEAPSAEDRYFPGELSFEEEHLSRAVYDLPLLRRQVLSMLFVEQLTALEIAERLGCPINYVYKEKHYALKKIREAVEGNGYGR